MKFLKALKDKFCKDCGKRPDQKRPTLNSKKSINLERVIVRVLEQEPLGKKMVIQEAMKEGFTSNQIEWSLRKLVKKGTVKFIVTTRGHRLYFLQESVV